MRRRLSFLAIALALGLAPAAAVHAASPEFRKWAESLPPNGWKLVEMNDGAGFAVFVKPPEPKETRVRLWTRYELMKPDAQGMASWVDYYDFDCANRKMILLTEIQYGANNQLGVLHTFDKPGEEKFVVPGTEGETLMKGACSPASTAWGATVLH